MYIYIYYIHFIFGGDLSTKIQQLRYFKKLCEENKFKTLAIVITCIVVERNAYY